MSQALQHHVQPDGTEELPGPVNWYIYYRVRTEFAASLQMRATLMQTCLRQQFGVAGALMRRPQPQDGRHIWMETYRAPPPDFDAILAAEASTADLLELIDGERHIEYFGEISSCA